MRTRLGGPRDLRFRLMTIEETGSQFHGRLPTRTYASDAGFDLYPTVFSVLKPGSTAGVPTGVQVAIPEGYYGRVAERSGLALTGIGVGGGVIDSAYRGEIKVILFNRSDTPVRIRPGVAIAQLIIERCDPFVAVEVDTLPPGERGSNGFGSTTQSESVS